MCAMVQQELWAQLNTASLDASAGEGLHRGHHYRWTGRVEGTSLLLAEGYWEVGLAHRREHAKYSAWCLCAIAAVETLFAAIAVGCMPGPGRNAHWCKSNKVALRSCVHCFVRVSTRLSWASPAWHPLSVREIVQVGVY